MIYFIHRLVNKRQEILETNSVISKKLSGRENELAKYDVTKPIISFPLQAPLFLVRFREALVNRRIFLSWTPQLAQNLFLRVDSASCWYNWLFQEGFLRKEKLSKFHCIWPLTTPLSSRLLGRKAHAAWKHRWVFYCVKKSLAWFFIKLKIT